MVREFFILRWNIPEGWRVKDATQAEELGSKIYENAKILHQDRKFLARRKSILESENVEVD